MSSRGQILRSTSIVGGAAALNIGIGLIRTKIAALLLGPLGIGEIGLFLNLVQLIATVGALGLGTSAVRQIAEALGRDCPQDVAAARRSLLYLSLLSSIAIGLLFAAFAAPIGHAMAFSAQQIPKAPWLSLAIASTILSGAPVALLISYRRIVDQALVQIGGAILGTIVGLGCLFIWGQSGIIFYTIAAPLTQLAFGLVFVVRIPRVEEPVNIGRIRSQALAMIALGLPFTVGALSMTGGMLMLRWLLADRLGLNALGQFTAAWTLCVTYVSFILQASGADYFPRLSSAIMDRDRAYRIVTEQFDVTLLISLPILIAVQAMGPWLLQVLYSSAFVEGIQVVRWQILGDVFKIAATPVAYIMLAAGRGKVYWLGETIAVVLLVSGTAIFLEFLGLRAVGIAYVAMYVGYFAFVLAMAWRIIGFRLVRSSITIFSSALGLVLTTTVCSMVSTNLGLVVGAILALGSVLYAIRSLDLLDAALRRWPKLNRWTRRPLDS